MIGKLAARHSGAGGQLSHKSIKVEVEVKTEITIRGTIRTGTYQITD